ncbi:acyl-CoA dehydrogenase, partial [Amycolatopsis alba DSM 44262]
MINLEVPKKAGTLINQAYQAAAEVFRPISRKYDRAEHTYPAELDMFAALLDGLNSSGEGGAGAAGVRRSEKNEKPGNRNGSNLNIVLGTIEMCWGDVGLLLSMPRQGLGNAAIGSVAT